MLPVQNTRTDPDEYLRCGEPAQVIGGERKVSDVNAGADSALADEVDQALWQDGILRALDYNSIEIRVKSGIVSLYGHVVSLTNRHQAENEVQGVGGVMAVKNHLIADDMLVAEVSTALGALEHAHGCKFFTGVSHGVVLLSGTVDDAKTKLLAEQCAAANPNVRGVIDSVRVRGSALAFPDQPFLQPTIGMEIFFLDGISGRVRQVIINPGNRRVIAMTVQGSFVDQHQELQSLNNAGGPARERLLVVPMKAVRHLTKGSGFLNIRSNETTKHMPFDPADFFVPTEDWSPPYPYCLQDVLFPVGQPDENNQTPLELSLLGMPAARDAQLLHEQLLENDSLGG